MADKEYFAIDLDANELMDKVEEYYAALETMGHIDRINRSYQVYYGNSFDAVSYKMLASGRRGEYTNLSGNHYRAFIQQQLSLTTSERPAFDVRPVNTDYTSMIQAILGEQILDYYLSAKKLEVDLRTAAEKSLWSSEGFIHMKWDGTIGTVAARDPETGAPVMSGDISYSTGTTLDCVRDIFKEGDSDWQIWREPVNKYELAAKFPEHEQHILSLPSVTQEATGKKFTYTRSAQTDMVMLWTFYHKKNSALPRGKYAYFIENHILQEGDLPYQNIPIYRITPANLANTCLGYTQGFDMLGNQEAYDRIFSANMSNVITFARQCIAVPRDANISVDSLSEGLSLIEYDQTTGEIKPIQLTQSSPEAYKMMELVERNMSVFSGINDVVRGDPEANLRSGNALALIAAQAIKFNSGFQQSYARLLEDVGTATLEFLKSFATSPRFAFIVGKNRRSQMKEFSSQDLDGVSRVEVQITSAVSKTQAGRIQIADNLLQQGLIKRPEQYISVVETGRLEPVIEAEEAELLNIRSENELLSEGKAAVMLALDNHQLHIREHKAVLDDPSARTNQEVIAATTAHIQEHLAMWSQLSTMQPALIAALGIPPIPATPPVGPMPAQNTPDMMQAGQGQQQPQIAQPNVATPPANAPAQDQAAFEQVTGTPAPEANLL